MKSSKLYYSANLKDIKNSITPNGYFILKLTSGNAHKWHELIQKCIDAFNKQVEWDDMWDFQDALTRFEQGHIMFVYAKIKKIKEDPIGYVWFDKDYLYNMFMTKGRVKGHTVKFVSSACHSLDMDIDNIHLHCDDWNIAAQKMFRKVGFKIIEK